MKCFPCGLKTFRISLPGFLVKCYMVHDDDILVSEMMCIFFSLHMNITFPQKNKKMFKQAPGPNLPLNHTLNVADHVVSLPQPSVM